jgi:ABC-type Fe3+/spermidine/putrescine transport system ATPase subunit
MSDRRSSGAGSVAVRADQVALSGRRTGGEAILRLEGISRSFQAGVLAVDDCTLELGRGEVLALLGPSGCGKTTTLRMVAGLEAPDAGSIFLNGQEVASAARKASMPPNRRNIGMVFQSYAIWPHLSVFDNVAYPLAARRVKKSVAAAKVHKALDQVGLGGFGDRSPSTLSGGQQQRVALARALVSEPAVLLLDEPFSNLDVALRQEMRLELKGLQRRLGISVLLVTHDQAEALSLADRVAVMNKGRVLALGPPKELYENPPDEFVRDFLGKSVTLRGSVEVPPDDDSAGNGYVGVRLAGPEGSLVWCPAQSGQGLKSGAPVDVTVRLEDVRVLPEAAGGPGMNTLSGRVEELLFVGDRYECEVTVAGQSLLVWADRGLALRHADPVTVSFPSSAARAWPKAGATSALTQVS